MAKRKKPPVQKKRQLTTRLNMPIGPELKNLIDEAAMIDGTYTNEWVAKVLAERLNRPDLAKIPRHRRGRPRLELIA